jgi:hypothetical protein
MDALENFFWVPTTSKHAPSQSARRAKFDSKINSPSVLRQLLIGQTNCTSVSATVAKNQILASIETRQAEKAIVRDDDDDEEEDVENSLYLYCSAEPYEEADKEKLKRDLNELRRVVDIVIEKCDAIKDDNTAAATER